MCVTLLLTQRSFEAMAVITSGTPDRHESVLLVQQLRRAAEAVSATSSVVASVERTAPNELRISCRSEQQLSARDACQRIARQAAKPPHLAQLWSPPLLPSEDSALHYVLLSVLLGCLWFLLRLRQSRKREARLSDPELAGWRVATANENVAYGNFERDDVVTTSDIRGLSANRPANDMDLDDFARRTTLHLTPQPQTVASHDSPRIASVDQQLAPRIIFRVGGNPFEPDSSVLTDSAMAQLREVCAQLLAATPRQRVVRIASGVSSRYAKTQITAQLSAMLAQQSELLVLTLEADIDAPALHKAMHLEAPLGLGLSEQLQRMQRQGRPLAAALIRVEGNLHALVESRTSTPDALGLPQFEQLVERLRAQYDFIVVDGPVLDTWPDSGHLSQCVDDVVMVAAAGTRLRDTHALIARHFNEDAVLSVVTAGDWSQLTGSI